MLKKHYLNSIFSRLFLSFLFILIPIYLFGTLIFTWGENAIKTEIKNTALSRVNFLKNNLESEIYRIKMLQGSIMNDRILNQFINEYKFVPEYDYYIMVSNVQQRLIIMKNSSSFIHDVTIHIPGLDKKISANSGYLDFNENDFNRLLSMLDVPYPVIFNDSKTILLMPFPLTSVNKNLKKPVYLVEIQLSDKALDNSMMISNTYSDSHIVLFDHTADKCITGTENSVDYKAILSKLQTGDDSEKAEGAIEIDSKKYFMVHEFSDYLNLSVLEFIPLQSMFKIPDRYRGFLWLFFLLSVLVLLFYSFSTYKFVHNPIKKILNAFRNVEKGDLKVSIRYKTANEFMNLYDGFNKMVSRLDELIEKVYVQEILAKKMELKQLQAQINPHFMYNSYFILHRMIKEEDRENAANLSMYMGRYFQYITRNASDEVFLHKEVEHAKNYTEIQTMRFCGRLTIEFGLLADGFNDILVPRMILQPVLENAIEHGMRDIGTDGFIRVCFDDNGPGVKIIIEDNGNSISDEDIDYLRKKITDEGYNAEITGFINVHRRIKLKYGGKSGLMVSRSELGGLMVVINIIAGEDG